MEGEKREPKERPEAKELSFDAGVAESVLRIEDLLKSKEEIRVAIYGSGINVGKTALFGAVRAELSKKGIGVATASDLRAATTHKPYFLGLQEGHGRVIFLDSEGLPFDGIDLRFFIRRPDTPFFPPETDFADIIINNEFAKDK